MARPPRSKPAAQTAPAPDKLQKRFDRRVRLSWLALLTERALEALLWPFVVVCAFLVFSLLGGFDAFGPVGLLIGPLMMTGFLTLVSIYRERYRPFLFGERDSEIEMVAAEHGALTSENNLVEPGTS